jgi:hypothetical protein
MANAMAHFIQAGIPNLLIAHQKGSCQDFPRICSWAQAYFRLYFRGLETALLLFGHFPLPLCPHGGKVYRGTG